jgi:hypothetical protein
LVESGALNPLDELREGVASPQAEDFPMRSMMSQLDNVQSGKQSRIMSNASVS